MTTTQIPIIGINGDPWGMPASTVESCWSAMGAGADGLMLSIFLSADGQLVCTPEASVENDKGEDVSVSSLTVAELKDIDAGAKWRSTVLDADKQPTSEHGSDLPWLNRSKSWMRNIFHPSLERVLQLFGRRLPLHIKLPGDEYPALGTLCKTLLELLNKMGLSQTNIIGSYQALTMIAELQSHLTLTLDITESPTDDHCSTQLAQLQCRYLLADMDYLDHYESATPTTIEWLFLSQKMPFAPTQAALEKLHRSSLAIAGLLTQGVLPTFEQCNPKGIVIEDSFAGTELNHDLWRRGISHASEHVSIHQDDGVIIDLKAGGNYTGAAYVSNLRIHGDFDSQVDFTVAHPHQGTTLEMAAITVNSGYTNLNLAFDVHGAPPYASSECDQDDGFRGGLNTSYTLTEFVPVAGKQWGDPWSSNMFNEYTPDVGTPAVPGTSGRLRLVRRGQIFNTYYKDKYNKEWVCSSAMLIQNIREDINIRLAAKHWKKTNPEPPANTITFKNFILYQV